MDQEILVENRRKSRCDNMLKLGSKKEGQMEEELKKYAQKGDELRFMVEIWDRIVCEYEREWGT